MFHFNMAIENKLKVILDNNSIFNLIIIFGEKGCGKSFLVYSVLQSSNIKYKTINFSSEPVISLEFDNKIKLINSDENSIYMKFTELFSDNYYLYFQNMELCDFDSERILLHMLQYYKKHDKKLNVILEYNKTQKPINNISLLSNYIIHVCPPKDAIFEKYYEKYFDESYSNRNIFNKMMMLSSKNIYEFLSIQNILLSMDVLKEYNKKLIYNEKTTYNVPNNIEDLYMDIFETQKDYIKNILFSAAPFSKKIYNIIINAVYNNYDSLDEYLRELSRQGYFIQSYNNSNNEDYKYFKSNYQFSDECIRIAILNSLEPKKKEEIVVNYNNYLDKLFCNKTIYNNLQNTEKILLLSMLTKKRHKQLTVNQIQYVTELMEYYYKAFLYLNAIKQAENLLENEIIDNLRLNKECHKFWVVYFNSLLAIANYKKIIEYKNCFEDDDLNYDVAVALYNSGYPYEALEQLEKMRNDISKYDGYSHLLKASIYDWLGNNKKSKNEFKKALLNGDDKIKYQILKRYNMYIDFRIPECRNKMKQAIDYYKENNLKQYAECLHNYGTGCIFIKDYENAQKYLNLSLDILNKICADQIYYPLNSLAILYCYNKCDYKKATNIIREALKCNINETFCKLALHNNLFNIAINMRDLELAYKEKNSLENIINNECNNNTNNDRSDIKHQIRQFYYNYALLFKSQNNITKALEYFKKADKCSNYESNVVYSIKRNIFELKKKKISSNFFNILKNKYTLKPNEIELYIYEREQYLCEIMFWG